MTRNFSFVIAFLFLSLPCLVVAQTPDLGTAADFVLFTSVGAVTNTGVTHLTGHVGSNSGSGTGFGNVNGVMHDQDGASAQAAIDLLAVYDELDATAATFFPAPLLGNGQVLVAGVYAIGAPATLNLDLTFDAQNDSNAVFIVKIDGAFSTNADAKVKLINGAKACNVFWVVEGLVDMAAGTSMKGNVIANNAGINMNANDTLEGRALSTTGAISVDNVLAYTPTGCGSPYLTGPAAPTLGTTACFALFSASGPVSNTGITFLQGSVGTNSGLTTGFDSLNVNGTIHLVPDTTTAQAASDLAVVYAYLNTLPHDIELLYPAQFGNNLVLTPHTYLLDAATSFTDTLYLNAEGNANAVFVIKINGALSTSTYSRVVLINGAQSKNVFWKVEGAVTIADYSVFRGIVVCNNDALGPIGTGVELDGRAFATTGAVTVTAITTTMAPVCTPFGGCAAVTNVTLNATSPTSAVINWTASLSAVKYRVSVRNMTSGVETMYFVLAPAVTRILNNLQPQTQYKVKLRTQCSATGAVLSSWSVPVYVTTPAVVPAPCATPTNITSTVTSSTTATVSWTPVTGVSGYQLRYRAVGTLVWMAVASNTGTQSSAMLTGLQAGTSYQYQLRAKCTVDPKTWSYYSSVYTFATAMRLGESDAMTVSVYPNPSTGAVNVATNFTAGTITVYDAVGKVVMSVVVNANEANTRVTGLPAGMLVYRFAVDNGTVFNGRFAVIN